MRSSQRFAAIVLSVCPLLAFDSFAESVMLAGGAVRPDSGGSLPTINVIVPIPSGDITSMNDGDSATGYTFTTHRGDFSSDPNQLKGFAVRYDFDISRYESIERIDFSWTGLQTWTGWGLPNVYVGSSFDGTAIAPQLTLNFGASSAPDNVVKTATLSYFADSTNDFVNFDRVIRGDVASFWVFTGLGFTSGNSTMNNLNLSTFEVSADVTGTLAPVPLPAAVWLLLSGLLGVAGMRGNRGV